MSDKKRDGREARLRADLARLLANAGGFTHGDAESHADDLLDELDAGKRDREELDELRRKMQTPQTKHFTESVLFEAVAQRLIWDAEHDRGKTPSDWFWLIGYLGGKALAAAIKGDKEKALHHTISTAAVLMRWHATLSETKP